MGSALELVYEGILCMDCGIVIDKGKGTDYPRRCKCCTREFNEELQKESLRRSMNMNTYR